MRHDPRPRRRPHRQRLADFLVAVSHCAPHQCHASHASHAINARSVGITQRTRKIIAANMAAMASFRPMGPTSRLTTAHEAAKPAMLTTINANTQVISLIAASSLLLRGTDAFVAVSHCL